MPLTSFYVHNLLGWTVTETVRLIGDRAHLQLAPTPSTGNGWPAARTVQDPFFRESGSKGHQVRPVAVGTASNQISSETLRTFHAMANSKTHRHARVESAPAGIFITGTESTNTPIIRNDNLAALEDRSGSDNFEQFRRKSRDRVLPLIGLPHVFGQAIQCCGQRWVIRPNSATDRITPERLLADRCS
jgi:hypothetical protein